MSLCPFWNNVLGKYNIWSNKHYNWLILKYISNLFLVCLQNSNILQWEWNLLMLSEMDVRFSGTLEKYPSYCSLVLRIWFHLLCLTPLSAIFLAISWRPVLVVEEAGVPRRDPPTMIWYLICLSNKYLISIIPPQIFSYVLRYEKP